MRIAKIINFMKKKQEVKCHNNIPYFYEIDYMIGCIFHKTRIYLFIYFGGTAASPVKIPFQFCLNIRKSRNMRKHLVHYYSQPCMAEHRRFKGFIVTAIKTLELKRRENQGPL